MGRLMRWLLPAVLASGLFGAPAAARTWTSASGTFQVEAELVEVGADGTVILKRSDGQTLGVRLEQLSAADQRHIRGLPRSGRPEAHTPERPPQTDKRRPVPDAGQVAKKLPEVRELLKSEYEQASTAKGRRALCTRLLQLAGESLAAEPAAAVAMALEASQLSADGDDLMSAVDGIAWLQERFDLADAAARKAALAQRIKVDGLSAQAAGDLVPPLLAILDELEDAADYETALGVSRLAVRAARRAQESELLANAQDSYKKLKGQQSIYERVGPARAALKKASADPAANLVMGNFLCLVRGKWDQGLAHLAAGDDAELAQLARADLAHPATAAEQEELAGQWWTLGESAKYASYPALKERAAHWYALALPQLTALDKLRAERRIEEVAPKDGGPETASVERSKPAGRPASKMAVRFQGRYYLVIPTPMSWSEARHRCSDLNGRLVGIDSLEKQQFVERLVRDGEFDRYWIDGYLGGMFTRWYHVFGGKYMNYFNWREGAPDSSPRKTYLLLRKDGKWENEENGVRAPYICEWDNAQTFAARLKTKPGGPGGSPDGSPLGAGLTVHIGGHDYPVGTWTIAYRDGRTHTYRFSGTSATWVNNGGRRGRMYFDSNTRWMMLDFGDQIERLQFGRGTMTSYIWRQRSKYPSADYTSVGEATFAGK